MVRLYLILIVLAVLGSVGAGAFWYYKDTQQRIQTLQENNAKLEVALETSEASINALQEDMAKFSELNKQLSVALQKAEAYGDELRTKLSKLNLVVEALRDSKVLEGKMNGASAKLWRGIMEESGNTNDVSLPTWLQPVPNTGTGDQSSNQGGENSGTNNSSTETTPAK
jgi:septal ring factor EnvC (AmiA/AmiB activator)